MQLHLITPEKTLFDGAITQVNLPGAQGEFGVLAGHEAMVASLKAGDVVVEAAGAEQRFAISGGLAEITGTTCTVLVDGVV